MNNFKNVWLIIAMALFSQAKAQRRQLAKQILTSDAPQQTFLFPEKG